MRTTRCVSAARVLILVGWLLPDAVDGQSCRRGSALLAAGRLDEATDALVDALETEADLPCAVEGLERVAERFLNRGMELLEADLLDSARADFIRAISRSPDSLVLWEAQRQILALDRRIRREGERAAQDSADPPGFAHALALSRIGMHEEARTAMIEELGSSPTVRVPVQLQYLSGGPLALWRSVQRWADPWVRFSPLLVVIVALGLHSLVASYRRPRLTVGPFGTEAIKDASDFGDGFGAMVGTELQKLVSGDPGQGPQLVRGELGSTEVPANVQGLFPAGGQWVDGLVRLLRWIEPSRTLVLEGHLHADNTKGLGVTTQLRQDGRFLAGATLWLSEFWPGGDEVAKEVEAGTGYPALAEAAAVWLLYHLPPGRSGHPMRILGTADWRAYALFRAAHRLGPRHRAGMFARSLSRDSTFAAALSNLGTEFFWADDAVSKTADTLERSRGLLERALELTERRGAGGNDPTRFTTRYSLSAVYDALGLHLQARDCATKLMASLDEVEADPDAHRDLRAYAERLRPSASMLAATVSRDAAQLRRLTKDEQFSPSARTQYSLACAWSTFAARTPAVRHEAERRALLHLARSVALSEGPKRWARTDRSLEWVRTGANTEAEFSALVDPPPAGRPDLRQPPFAKLRALISEARSLGSRGG